MTELDVEEDEVPKPLRVRRGGSAFLLLSCVLHVLLFAMFGAWLDRPPPPFEIDTPDQIELGVMDGDPGEAGEPPPAAPPAPEPEKVIPKEKPTPKLKPEPELAASDFAVDASVPTEAANTATEDDPKGAVEVTASGAATGDDGAMPSDVSGDGLAPLGLGGGLGFGAGGFGNGLGGPAGAVIGLHVDLDRIRDSSLILEVSALLDLIPEWLALLDGSGLDALQDFHRIFVASPSLKRSALVVSGRVRGGQAAITRATNALAREKGKSATFVPEGELRVAPWYNRGPTARVIGTVGKDQIVIARPSDVSRALAVSAALGQRHSKQKQMERMPGALSLLAMYEGEAVALSVEGVAQYARGDKTHAPLGLRLSLREVDELNAELRGYGYYRSVAEAEAALPVFEELRAGWLDHPQVQYLGLRAALEEAKLARDGKTLTLVVGHVTMHQVRYLMGFVSRTLKPRD